MNENVGETLRKRREELGLGLRELCRRIDKTALSGCKVSPSYYSQVENCSGIRPEKTTMDFFWAVAIAMDLDPIELFLQSRPKIPKDQANDFLKQLLLRKLNTAITKHSG